MSRNLQILLSLYLFLIPSLASKSDDPDPVGTLDDDHGANPHDDGVSTQIHVVLLLVIGGVSLSMCLETIQHRYHFTFLPGPATAVFLGAILGLFIRLTSNEGDIPSELGFSGEIFFLILLPIIIFQAGYSLRKKEFFGQLVSILTFSVIGTALAAFVIGTILYGAGHFGWSLKLTLNEALAYASIVSATDAVAVANMYRSLDVDPMLSVLIYGEGSVNDATSIVMYQTFAHFMDEGVSNEGWSEAAEAFAEELFGSIFFGILIGILGTFIFRIVHIGWIPPLFTQLFSWCPRSRSHDYTGLSNKVNLLSDDQLSESGVKGHVLKKKMPTEKSSLLESSTSKKTNSTHEEGVTSHARQGDGLEDDDVFNGMGEEINDVAALAAHALHAARSDATGRFARSSFAIFDPPDKLSIPLDMARAITRDKEVKPDSSVFAQCAFILLMGYFAYMSAECLHISGVVAVLFTGISLNHFVRPLLSTEGKDFSEGTIRVLAEIADLTTFFQVGLDAALTMGTREGIDSSADAAFLGFLTVGCFVGRAVGIFFLGGVVNYFRRKPIPFNYQLMLWHAGLRGAGAYAFTLNFPGQNRDVLIDATAGLILITVLFCGATTSTMLSSSGIPWGHNFDPADSYLHPKQHEDKDGPIRRMSMATMNEGGGRDDKGSYQTGSEYRAVIVQGAKVYIKNENAEHTRGAEILSSREKTLNWINSLDTKIRFWVSGVVREE
jgi:NhaP-type Na+/H+ or K+/H+ antiporter